jgi:hypothetical protein
MSPLERAIRERAWFYVLGEVGRDQFMDWFAPVLMTEVGAADPIALDLADDIAHYDAEFTSGAGSEENLREAIRWRLHVYRGRVPEEPQEATFATGSDNFSTPGALSSIGAGR